MRIKSSKWFTSSLFLDFVLIEFIRLKPRSQSALDAWNVPQMSSRIDTIFISSSFKTKLITSEKVWIDPVFTFSAIKNLKSLYCSQMVDMTFSSQFGITLENLLISLYKLSLPNSKLESLVMAEWSNACQSNKSSSGNLFSRWLHNSSTNLRITVLSLSTSHSIELRTFFTASVQWGVSPRYCDLILHILAFANWNASIVVSPLL